jgi:guanylate kinase
MVKKGLFIEHAEFSDNLYGTSFESVRNVLDQKKNVILDIDMQGVLQLKEKLSKDEALLGKPLYIFLAPPSVEILEQRLRARGSETERSLVPRLQAAKTELAWGTKPGACDYIITNNDLETAYHDLIKCFKREKILESTA